MIFIHYVTTEILNQQSQNDYLTVLRVVVKYIPHFSVKLDNSYERVVLAIFFVISMPLLLKVYVI